ncbi:F-box/FBD/LRR-repeat protein [Raphanus sativus]|nr:F-box/FBD/LRR-repeat protein [Raphanus sativus]
MEKLISSSLLLEDLTLISLSLPKDVEKILHVQSQTLKRIEINFSGEVEIDAPLLQCLRANVNVHEKFKITNSGFSAKADISFRGLCDHGLIHDIFTEILRVRDLDISSNTWKELLVGVAGTKVMVPTVPPCLVSSLKFVEFKRPISGYETEMKLVKYFLKNSTILKKLTLRISNYRMIKAKDALLGELFSTPKFSIDCEILVL